MTTTYPQLKSYKEFRYPLVDVTNKLFMHNPLNAMNIP